jgi:hypothetical protein
MLFDRHLFSPLVISLAACTAPPHPVPPPSSTFPDRVESRSAPAGAASPELMACMEQARVAAMVAARPDAPYPNAAGCADLVIENAYSSNFIVTSVRFMVDGSTLLDRADPVGERGPVANTPVFRVFLGPLAPGKHTLRLLVWLRVSQTSSRIDLRDYRAEVHSSRAFAIVSTGGTEVRSILYERDPTSLKLENQPAIRYVVVTHEPLTEPSLMALQ